MHARLLRRAQRRVCREQLDTRAEVSMQNTLSEGGDSVDMPVDPDRCTQDLEMLHKMHASLLRRAQRQVCREQLDTRAEVSMQSTLSEGGDSVDMPVDPDRCTQDLEMLH